MLKAPEESTVSGKPSERGAFAFAIENDTGILRESVGNHDALVLREGKEAEVRLDPVDGNRHRLYSRRSRAHKCYFLN